MCNNRGKVNTHKFGSLLSNFPLYHDIWYDDLTCLYTSRGLQFIVWFDSPRPPFFFQNNPFIKIAKIQPTNYQYSFFFRRKLSIFLVPKKKKYSYSCYCMFHDTTVTQQIYCALIMFNKDQLSINIFFKFPFCTHFFNFLLSNQSEI